MIDKHGCPAYVSPEILNPNKSYSGKAADIWSIGVMLYTMLVGRYPFHDREASTLFMKIRKGDYSIPDCISSRAKCLLRSLLRHDPSERLQADEIIQHPWFKTSSSRAASYGSTSKLDSKINDQLVPEMNVASPHDFFVWMFKCVLNDVSSYWMYVFFLGYNFFFFFWYMFVPPLLFSCKNVFQTVLNSPNFLLFLCINIIQLLLCNEYEK